MTGAAGAEPETGAPELSLRINGGHLRTKVDPDTPLLWFLRDELGLKGTKYGCGTGYCGACLVLIDGEPNHACMVPLHRVGERAVTTIEGLAEDPTGRAVIEAWVAGQVPQCGYCQPAQIVAAAAVLGGGARPAPADIEAAMDGVLCRCGTYQRIRRAIAAVAEGRIEPSRGAAVLAGDVVLAKPEGVVVDDWVSIEPDNSAVLMINHSEMGQGALNAVATLIAEELEVDLDHVRVANAPAASEYANPTFGTQLTGGSTTVRGEWERLRRAGASVRERLIAAAMEIWKVERADCRAERGVVVHAPSGRTLAYNELAARAAEIAAPKQVALKPPSAFRLIGRSAARADIAPMSKGVAKYGMDVTVPHMVVASIARAPQIGAALASFEASAALAVPGVVDVVAVESGVAVVARDFWSASRGRAALDVRWTPGDEALDTASIYRALETSLEKKGKVTTSRGAASRALEKADRVIEARYRTPYLAHLTIEPPNCLADVRGDRCELWVGTQDQSETQRVAARLTGLAESKIQVHTTFLGGGFGRRLETDFVAEAVELSAKLERPVQLVWTREDDLQHDKYRPAHAIAIKAGLNARGRPTAWWQRLAGPSVSLGNCDMPYAVADFHEEKITMRSPLPEGAWRGVGAVQNAFAIESFIDELAHIAHADPLDYRLALLEHSPRHRAVLEAAAALIGWRDQLDAGRGRGIAVYRAFGSWTAQAAEVSCSRDGKIDVHRIVCAIDCGQALNPDTIRAQIEGGIALGLSAALKEEIEVVDGRIKQTTLADYPILRYSEMPEVDVEIIANGDAPGGVGEPPVPLVAPAVANAVFAATGKRLQTLPMRL